MIDWARVADLYDDFGDADFVEVVDVFLEESDDGVQRLAQSQTPAEDRAAFHFLKGAALNLGFDELSRLCAEGEEAAASGADTDKIKQQVCAQFPATCSLLQSQWRARLCPDR